MENNRSKGHIVFLDFLRVVAVLLVVWDHLVGEWLIKNNVDWFVFSAVKKYITIPLAITQNFGFLGVVIFFLISGYVITFVSCRENRVSFIVKRAFKIYPPLIISIILIVFSYKIYGVIFSVDTFIDQMSIKQILFSGTLLNYFSVDHHSAVNGVAWTLIIEVLFYIMCFIGINLLKNKPRIFIIVSLLFVMSILYFCRSLGGEFFLFAATIAYIPYLLLGQLIFFLVSNKLNIKEVVLYSILNYLLIIYGIQNIHNSFYEATNSYGVSFLYGYLIFIIAMLLDNHIKMNKMTNAIATISYSFYLNHGLGLLFLSMLYPFFGYLWSLLITLPPVILVSYLSWRYIEEPSRKLANKIVRRKFAGN